MEVAARLSEAAASRLRRPHETHLGLLLGQVCSSSYEIIYSARTPGQKLPSEDKESESESLNTESSITNLLNVSDGWIADHAKHVTRMLPGGIFVLGIFITCPDNIFEDKALLTKIKNILSHMNKILSVNKYMYGVPESSNRLVMHCYKNITCKSIDVENLSNASYKSVDVNVHSNTALSYFHDWQQLDCYQEFDEIYPVVMRKSSISVKGQFEQILVSARQSVESSLVFLDGKLREGSDLLASINETKEKKLSPKDCNEHQQSKNIIQVSVFLPSESNMDDFVEYLECEGTTHFSGIVFSRVYLNPKATIQDAVTAVKQDIVRSLASRFTMHCDALISDNLLPEEKVCFNELPRRVLIRLPGFKVGHIFFCDYLFPGESPGEALASVKEMFDADISEDDVISNIETPADTSEFDALEKNPSNEELLSSPRDPNKIIYIFGIAVSILIGLTAVTMHFYMNYGKTNNGN